MLRNIDVIIGGLCSSDFGLVGQKNAELPLAAAAKLAQAGRNILCLSLFVCFLLGMEHLVVLRIIAGTDVRLGLAYKLLCDYLSV
jgi:hypothetical protein